MIDGIAFTIDEQTLISGTAYDGTVRLWDLANGSLMQKWRVFKEGHMSNLCLAISPDGTLLATAGNNAMAWLWRIADGELLRVARTEKAHSTWTIVFSPSGRIFATGGFDGKVRLWRVADGTLLHTLEGHRGQRDPITRQLDFSGGIFRLAWSPDGQSLASAGDTTVRVWHTPQA